MPVDDQSAIELIASKTRVPPARKEFIERTRLLEPLVDGAGPIVVIEAPAGYGKSTLLEQWAAREPRPVAFVRLDRSESDPVLFWRYMVAAVKPIAPEAVAQAERELNGAAPLVEDVAVPRFLNALDEYDGRIVLMLAAAPRSSRSRRSRGLEARPGLAIGPPSSGCSLLHGCRDSSARPSLSPVR